MGIIGCGDVAEVKSGPAFQKADGSELVAVMRRTASLAEDYARRHGVARWHDDADAILLADDIDAVYIATHPNTHLEYAARAAGAGKAVYLEKPMAMSEAECREMQAACDRVGVPLWVAYYQRALRRFEKIRQIVHDGTIGDIRAVESRRLQKVRTEAWQNTGALWRRLLLRRSVSHPRLPVRSDVRRARPGNQSRWQGSPRRHGCRLVPLRERGDRQRYVVLRLRCRRGLHDRHWLSRYVSFSISTADPIRVTRGRATEEIVFDDPPHVHQPLVQSIIDEINGRGHCPSTGTTALGTARAMDRILADVTRL